MGKQEDYLHCIDKGDKPLTTLHVDHLRSLDATSKKYKYILAVEDGFSKFTWLYPTKSTDAAEEIKHMRSCVTVFQKPTTYYQHKGTAFTSKHFKEFCADHNIDHVEITTANHWIARGNGLIERVNRVILSVLAKMSAAVPSNTRRRCKKRSMCMFAHQLISHHLKLCLVSKCEIKMKLIWSKFFKTNCWLAYKMNVIKWECKRKFKLVRHKKTINETMIEDAEDILVTNCQTWSPSKLLSLSIAASWAANILVHTK